RDGRITKLEEEKEIRPSDVIITKKGKLLTLNAELLMEYGVADFMVPPLPLQPLTDQEEASGQWEASKNMLFHEPFFSQIPNAKLIDYRDWRVDFFAFLTHPLISSLLFMGLMIGVYMELNHPGFGVPGIVGLTCLVLILLSSFAIETINWI